MESSLKKKLKLRSKRTKRVRKKLKGTASRPRLCVNITNKYIYAQLINDEQGTTIAAASSLKDSSPKSKETAAAVGDRIGKKAKEANIDYAVFDRGFRKYHGLLSEIADKAREAGLQV